MPKECSCEIALREHIPVRSLVWIIVSFYHQDDAAIIKELKYCNLDANDPMRLLDRSQLIEMEQKMPFSQTADLHYIFGDMKRLIHGNSSDRWIFEASTSDSFTRFLGVDHGSPIVGACSRCIIKIVDDKILVEIDTVRIDIDPRGEFGSYFGTPFMRSRRAKLRSQMYNLQYLEPDDPQHALFDKVCDLAHKTIWEWLH